MKNVMTMGMTMEPQAIPPQLPPDEFLTGDLGVAAFLVSSERPLLAVRYDGRRAIFVFPGPAKDLAAKFWQPGADLVSGRRFHTALRDLRGLAREAMNAAPR